MSDRTSASATLNEKSTPLVSTPPRMPRTPTGYGRGDTSDQRPHRDSEVGT